jgi:phenylpyruvate tautomerase PptA (4-oxalocrotonate tautomerase family)
MPYINTQTNVTVTNEQIKEMTAAFGKAIEIIPGKTEEWLMLRFNGDQVMAFRGDLDTPCCILEVEIAGKSTREYFNALTQELTAIMGKVLGIAPENVYVKYEEIDYWGYNGGL